MTIFIANDSTKINDLYRSGLILSIEEKGYEVRSISFWKLFRVRLTKRQKDLLISSNIRTNIITLLLFYSNVRIILNGLGRHRNKKMFRIFIGFLMSIGIRKILVQNYCDYRYFRRFFKISYCEWIPGSGAVIRAKNVQSGFFKY